MNVMRRILGGLIMLAGILGLVLSLAGVAAIWVLRPTVSGYLDATIQTLDASIDTSQMALEVTDQALGGTVASVDALSIMLSTTAASVEDTQPVLDKVNLLMGETVPSTLESASDSLETAQQAAVVLDSAIKSLNSFQSVVSATPLLSAFVEQPDQAYDPEVPLAESLGELAKTLNTLPATFTEMATDLDEADDNLVIIQDNLVTMSDSIGLISESLSEYQNMIGQSQASMESLGSILDSIHSNQNTILNWATIVLSVFFFWLLAAQVVILSQGWELYQGTADRMEGGGAVEEPQVEETVVAEEAEEAEDTKG